MAPVLQCPECGRKHPLASVPERGAFACAGCGRALKVPEVAGRRAATGTSDAAPSDPAGVPAPRPAPEPAPEVAAEPRPRPVPVATAVARPASDADDDTGVTRTVASVDEQALGALGGRGVGRAPARLGRVPWWMRLLLWIVAVPLSFLVVFLIARALGVFTSSQLSDLFLASGRSRFWPVARLLPFVALATATMVQVGVYGLARMRGRARAPRSGA